jgi:hypothetical protein
MQETPILVLDETDRLVDMGFRPDIEKILAYLPKKEHIQTHLFSATVPKELKHIMSENMRTDLIEADCIHEEDSGQHINTQVEQSHVVLSSLDRYVITFIEIVQQAMNEDPENHLGTIPWTRKLVTSGRLHGGLVMSRLQRLVTIFAFSFAVTLTALFGSKTNMWEGVPTAFSVVFFFVLMCHVGVMEGTQIALFAVVNLPEEELAQYTIAKANCKLTFTGTNLQAFLIGRQIYVTVCTFVVARITTLNIEVGVDDNIFGVSDGVLQHWSSRSDYYHQSCSSDASHLV